MVGNQRPGKTLCPRLGQHLAESIEENVPVDIVFEDLVSLNSACHDVMQGTRSVYACLAWHAL